MVLVCVMSPQSLRTSRINAYSDSYCDSDACPAFWQRWPQKHCSYSIARLFVPLHIEQSSLTSYNVHDAATEHLQCTGSSCIATTCGGVYCLFARHTRPVINAF